MIHDISLFQIFVLPPLRMEIVTEQNQFVAPSEFHIHIQMKTLLPETGEEVIFEDCSNIQYDVQLSDDINFEVTSRASKKNIFFYSKYFAWG